MERQGLGSAAATGAVTTEDAMTKAGTTGAGTSRPDTTGEPTTHADAADERLGISRLT